MTTELELFLNTGALALLSAAVALVAGIPMGLFVLGLPKKFRSLVSAFFAIPFLLPAFLVGITLLPILEYFQAPWFWVVFAHGFMNAGFIALVFASATSGIPKEQFEQAKLEGTTISQLVRMVVIPQISGALAGASLLVALYSATSYGLVISLGQGKIQTLETEIAQTVLYQLNFEQGILLASLQTILTLVFIAGTRAFTKTGLANLFSRSSYRFTSHPIGVIFGFSYLLVFSIFVFSILVRADLPKGFTILETKGARDVLNVSVIEAALNSFENLLVALVISFPIAWFIATRKSVFLSRLVVLPIGISPVVIGLFFLLVAGYWLGANLDTFFLIPMAQSLILIPLIFQIIKPTLEALDVEILDAAKLDSASSLKTWWFITAPLIRKPLVVALAFASLASLGEFGASSFLALGSDATLSLVMFQLASRPGFSNMSMAMTIALLYLLLSAVVVYLVSRERTSD